MTRASTSTLSCIFATLCAILALAAGPLWAQSEGPRPQHPISGTGSGGAEGPSRLDALIAVPRAEAVHPPRLPDNDVPAETQSAEVPSTTQRLQSSDARVDESALGRLPQPGPAIGNEVSAAAPTVNSSFTSYGDTDVPGSTNGTYVVYYAYYAGEIDVYKLAGGLVQATTPSAFWCGGANPLPICSSGGTAVDTRVKYDTGSQRWIISGLWLFGNNKVPTDALAVSRTSDPTGGWYRYQFPACGAFDTWDGSDQPHTGFNSQWIAVTSACSASSGGVNGAGLAVFDKANLYRGGTLTLNTNWFEFVDPYSGGPYHGIGGGNGTRDNPVATYTSTINNREYLTVRIPAAQAEVLYSHIEGTTDAPVFYSGTETVTTSFAVASGVPAVDAPGCTGCIATFVNGWIHSSAVYGFANGDAYILSTMVLGDPNHARATQIISIAVNTKTGAATALQVASGIDGSGPLASEIAMPLVRSGSADVAYVVYDHSRFDFYPGVKDISWNVDTNSVNYITVLREGSLTPNNGDQNRWADFDDALAPIPGSTHLVLGGLIASPSANDSQRATFWADVTP
ncbi:MAG TPA: hypothetical protein VMW75_17795 [Thermoanaerobaculia bacterium]|nr:hypothetical protein [Thermoanaerobaculia bacterium]